MEKFRSPLGYYATPSNIPEERGTHKCRGGSLKSKRKNLYEKYMMLRRGQVSGCRCR
jgi:hypothetical protein